MYIDPIACNIHHARTSREFVYTRVETPQRSFEDFPSPSPSPSPSPKPKPDPHPHPSPNQDFLFKKELWTSIVIARHLPWDPAGPKP